MFNSSVAKNVIICNLYFFKKLAQRSKENVWSVCYLHTLANPSIAGFLNYELRVVSCEMRVTRHMLVKFGRKLLGGALLACHC